MVAFYHTIGAIELHLDCHHVLEVFTNELLF